MSRLREAAQEAIGLICSARLCEVNSMSSRREMLRLLIEATDTLRAALAAPSTFGAVVTITERDTAQVCAELCERVHHNVPPFTSYAEAAQDCADRIRTHFKIARPE